MTQNTNLNIFPYYDDFDPLKNYYKVLFKPGISIQAREITTLQSILQNQIERFGNHFFKEGSVVIPGQIAYDFNYTCVEINDSHLGIPVSAYIDKLVGKLIQGETSGIKAKIDNYITNVDSDRSNYTLYIKYQSSDTTNFELSEFNDTENLIILEDVDYSLSTLRANSTFATTISSESTSVGTAAKIAAGVYFIRGYFVEVSSQTVILDQYTNTPSYRIGLSIQEDFAVASNEYNDLFDNAQGFSNYTSSGADRLVINTTLIKKSLDDFNDENFIELLRVSNGIVEKIIKTTTYNLLADEFARRTYDESGNYYVKPFKVVLNESLNDKIGNNGIYNINQQTKGGGAPSDDLACLSIDVGKAYVRGYEIETPSTSQIDINKPRQTATAINESIPFSIGKQIILNNVYGSIPVGINTTSIINLYSDRTSSAGSPSGTQIGVARVYDFKLKNSEYVDKSTKFECALYDIQTYTNITLNSNISSISTPAFIEGKNGGASGYLVSNVTDSNAVSLYQVSGTFLIGEQIKINGIDDARTIRTVRDYGISDIHQLYQPGFTADVLLSKEVILGSSSSFSISNGTSGISTVTSSNQNFYSGINVGDIVSYTIGSSTLPTYSKVFSVSPTLKSITIAPVVGVPNVCLGSLPTTASTVNDFKKITLELLNTSNDYLYSELYNKNISNLDLDGSDVIIKKSYNIAAGNFTTGSYSITLESGNQDLTLEPFDEEDYTLTFSDGTIVSLDSQKVTPNNKTITIQGIPANSNAAILTVTFKKVNAKTRKKIYNPCSTLVVNKTSSGVSTSTSGLTFSNVYGIRVEDKEISLNIPDVESVLAVYESSTTADPELPSITLTNLNSNISNSSIGEKLIGSASNAVAILVSNTTNNVNLVYLNENRFVTNEEVTFEVSNIKATVFSVAVGDKNIIASYIFDNGYRNEFLDFSRIIRKPNSESPTKKLKIVYNNYTINPDDDGDFVGVNSYDKDRYSFNIPIFNGIRSTDIIDLRPRVSAYSGSGSPFEFNSRVFSSEYSSSPYIFSKDKTINLSYSYYLPRIDKLFLTKDGDFIINSGVPSITPKLPNTLDSSLEVATIYLPAYLYNVEDCNIVLSPHKRYTMKDISNLDDRISNVEYYTSLSLLETDTKNLTIRDSQTNLNKFKCGFFVDNFKTLDGGDSENLNFKASIDLENGTLRPQHYTTSLDLLLGSELVSGTGIVYDPDADPRYVKDLGSPNIKKVGEIVCLNYKDVEYVANRFSSRVENVNPFNVINWFGSIALNPSSDSWFESKVVGRNTVNVEGNFNSTISRLGADSNTGLAPAQWNSWNDRLIASGVRTGRTQNVRGASIEVQDTIASTRTGTQVRVNEQFDTTTSTNIVSQSIILQMRSRNIEVVAKRLKPNTRLYGFFDSKDMNPYFIPKLLEVNMVSGTFQAGETVTGILGSKNISFRLASQNHKYGPYNAPTETYAVNPYQSLNGLSSVYSSTSTLLNVDTFSLQLKSTSQFYGCVAIGMQLIGEISGAIATISDLRLISDSSGTLIASLFIPDSNLPSTPSFPTGSKTLTLTSSSSNSQIAGISDSSAEAVFTSNGTLNNTQETTLRIRNATTTTNAVFDSRVRTTNRWVDPLAQSFEVADTNGVFITKCDIFFRSKDTNNIPVTLQIRTMQNGTPTQQVLPFAEISMESKDVNISEDGTASTTFIFPSPVYLEQTGGGYALVLVSASDSYTVWISRMGETDISTINKPDSEKIIISQQPSLGSLFKSQNGSTWDPSQLEDLKFVLYRADFDTSGSVRFYNPELNIGNRQIVSLSPNPISAYSQSAVIGLGKSLTSTDISNLTVGAGITQLNNPYFSGKLVSTLGTIGIGSALSVNDIGNGFTTSTTYSNVNIVNITGYGGGATVTLVTNASGNVSSATVSSGGSGYAAGDTLTIDYNDTNNFGKNLVLSIPNDVGIISAFNSIRIDNIQGTIDNNTNVPIDYIVSNGIEIVNAYVSSYSPISTGTYLKVSHSNHGMYSSGISSVSLSGIESDVAPAILSTEYSSTSTADIKLSSVSNFTTFENRPVGVANPGYILITNEIIQYTSVDTNTNTLGGILRAIDSTKLNLHKQNNLVFKYEFNGVSLRRINKTHAIQAPIEIDSYHIHLNMSSGGVNRTVDNNLTGPKLFFNSTKSGGSYLYTIPQTDSLVGLKATQNIAFNLVKPNVQTLLPNSTTIESRIRTFSGTSVSGNEVPYIDNGYENISLNSNNYLSSTRIICSKVNEEARLEDFPGKKSLTLEMVLSTNDSKVSPMIDLDRVNLITVMNRIDNPVSDFTLDPRVNGIDIDPNSAIYISKQVTLAKSADSLKVLLDAYKHSSNEIKVMYRLFRNDSPNQQQKYELFPGYTNLDENGNIINYSKNTGDSDTFISPSVNSNDFRGYEYTASNLPVFNGFQIKIIMTGTNQSFVPEIKNLRAIATL
jgi:hypothetical protein